MFNKHGAPMAAVSQAEGGSYLDKIFQGWNLGQGVDGGVREMKERAVKIGGRPIGSVTCVQGTGEVPEQIDRVKWFEEFREKMGQLNAWGIDMAVGGAVVALSESW